MSNKIYPFDLDASALIFLAYTYHAEPCLEYDVPQSSRRIRCDFLGTCRCFYQTLSRMFCSFPMKLVLCSSSEEYFTCSISCLPTQIRACNKITQIRIHNSILDGVSS